MPKLYIGLTQLASCAFGSPSTGSGTAVLSFSIVCGFSARSAEKPHTRGSARTIIKETPTATGDLFSCRRRCVSTNAIMTGTGGGNRTRDWSLEGSRVTTTPLPHAALILTGRRRFVKSHQLTILDFGFTIGTTPH